MARLIRDLARKAGKQHDWNRMEILAIGNRIRHVINGRLVVDWSDPKPELKRIIKDRLIEQYGRRGDSYLAERLGAQ